MLENSLKKGKAHFKLKTLYLNKPISWNVNILAKWTSQSLSWIGTRGSRKRKIDRACTC